MAWQLRYEGAVPALPASVRVAIRGDEQAAERRFRTVLAGDRPLLRHGAWAMRMEPVYADDVEREFDFPLCYEGVLRLQWVDTRSRASCRIRASGDLYLRQFLGPEQPELPQRLTTYPIRDFRYYFRVESIQILSRYEIRMDLDFYRFSSAGDRWRSEGRLQAILLRRAEGRSPLLSGEVRNEGGVRVAGIQLRHVAPHFRRAVVQMARVPLAAFPTDAGKPEPGQVKPQDLSDIFAQADWKLETRHEDELLEEPAGAVWSNNHLHEEMLKRRKAGNELDCEWVYRLFCVRRIDQDIFFKFGRLFDAWPSDSNNVPREGVVVANGAYFPLDEKLFGSAAGQMLGRVPKVYLHTVAHELGHAMGLAHNFSGTGIMQGIDNLAASAGRRGKVLTDVLDLRFDREDANRLRHLPDLWVRPGGVSFLSDFAFEPVPAEDLVTPVPGLVLDIRPLNPVLPLGAPLRLVFELRNEGDESISVPQSISLQSGHLSGRVVQDNGTQQEFASIVRYVFGAAVEELSPWKKGQANPKSSKFRAETLLRGNRGALLPSPGVYRIEAEVAWDRENGRVSVPGSTSVLVTEPKNLKHARAALKVLSSRESLLPLVFKTSSERLEGSWPDIEAAEEALRAALDSAVLRPHFALIEAKRMSAVGKAEGLADLAGLITGTKGAIMTASEAESLDDLLEQAVTTPRGPAVQRLKEAANQQMVFRSGKPRRKT